MTPTDLIHHPYLPPVEFAAPQGPVFKASTVIFPNVAAMRTREWKDKSAYTYGLHGTPTTFTLEERLCTLEGGLQCVLLPSGLAAVALVAMALLKTGDELLLPDNAYGPNLAFCQGELAAWGITYQRYDAMNPADLAAKITDKTRLVWLEAAGSCTLEFPDLPAMVAICRARGVTTALDNTWGAGVAFKPFDLLRSDQPTGANAAAPLGVDVSAHALTKYPSGGGDVLMGSVITRDLALHRRIKDTHMRLGFGVSGNDAELVLRSLPSIHLRYAAADTTTRALAAWALTRPEFAQVMHPSLATSPGHSNWQALCDPTASGLPGSAACLFSVMVNERFSQGQVDAFCDGLKFFKLGYSWAGPMSLVVPYKLATMRVAWPKTLQRGHLVRFSAGLERAEDLIADLRQAANAAFA